MHSNRPIAEGTVIVPMTRKVAEAQAAELNKRWPHAGAEYKARRDVIDDTWHLIFERVLSGSDIKHAKMWPLDPITCDVATDGKCLHNVPLGFKTPAEYVAEMKEA